MVLHWGRCERCGINTTLNSKNLCIVCDMVEADPEAARLPVWAPFLIGCLIGFLIVMVLRWASVLF